jgi:hypothetical protein
MSFQAHRFGTMPRRLRGSAFMGEVILFRLRTTQSRRSSDSAARAGGQIVFFTGVRYARMPEAVAAQGAGDIETPPAGRVGGAGPRKRRRRA